jgi:O-antigen/teichoic acid export membrane protein
MKYEVFAKQTILIFLANFIVGLSGIILLPILTKSLSITDYGIYVQLNVTISLIPVFILMGLPSYAMVRFLSGQTNKRIIQEGFYSIALFILLISVLVSFLILLLSKQISQIIFANNILIVKILSLIIIFSSFNIFLQYYFITFQQIKKYSLLLCLKTISSTILIIGFVLYGNGVIGIAIGILCNEFLFLIINYRIIYSEIGIKFPQFTELKKYLNLSVPTIPGSLSYWVVDSSDRYLIGILLGVTSVGYYSPGYTLGSIVLMFASPITSILTASLSKSYNEKKEDEVKNLLENSIKYFLVISIPVVIGLSILAKPILSILSTTEIAINSYMITPFVAMGFLILGLNNIIVNIIILKTNTKIISITWIMAGLLNVLLNLILIPYYGIIGAALSTIITYTIPFIFITHFSLKYIKLNFNWFFPFKVFLASSSIILTYQIWNPSTIIDILLFIFANILIYSVLIISLKVFNKEELSFILNVLKLN